MSGWGDECEAACKLADRAARRLKDINPSHELLKYWFLSLKEDPKTEKTLRTEMKDRFWRRPEPWADKPEMMVLAIILGNYYLTLEEAIQELTKEEKKQ